MCFPGVQSVWPWIAPYVHRLTERKRYIVRSFPLFLSNEKEREIWRRSDFLLFIPSFRLFFIHQRHGFATEILDNSPPTKNASA